MLCHDDLSTFSHILSFGPSREDTAKLNRGLYQVHCPSLGITSTFASGVDSFSRAARPPFRNLRPLCSARDVVHCIRSSGNRQRSVEERDEPY